MASIQLLEMIPDLLAQPLERRGGGIYRGRLQNRNPQWLLNPDDLHATTALTVRDIVTAVDNRLIWTDQLVQRGVRPEKEGEAEVELCVADGYPDPSTYVFYPEKSDDMTVKLLAGQQGLRLSPLVWNLRPGRFQVAVDSSNTEASLYLYRGRIYLPDGHHRHQAIVKAFRLWEEAPDEYPAFDPERQFTVDIYFMSRRDEAEYFYQKNVLSRPVERSKSFDLTEQDALSVLAKRVIDSSESLQGNVNRVTDRLAASNPQVVTLSTLREMMLAVTGTEALTEGDIAGLAPVIGRFWEMLAQVRPELGKLDVAERRAVRRTSMAAQAVVMYGYAELMRRFLLDIEAEDLEAAVAKWQFTLEALRQTNVYSHPDSGWVGDFFARSNPLWREIGVLQRTKSGNETVSNVRQTREQTVRVLVERLGL